MNLLSLPLIDAYCPEVSQIRYQECSLINIKCGWVIFPCARPVIGILFKQGFQAVIQWYHSHDTVCSKAHLGILTVSWHINYLETLAYILFLNICDCENLIQFWGTGNIYFNISTEIIKSIAAYQHMHTLYNHYNERKTSNFDNCEYYSEKMTS